MTSSRASENAGACISERLLGRRPGRPRDAGADAAILEATWEEVNREGLAGLSVEKVASRAGVSKSTIYRRWPSKESLVLEAWKQAHTHVDLPDTGSLRGDLQALRSDMHDDIQKKPMAAFLPQMVAASQQNPEMGDAFRSFAEEQRAPLRTVFQRAIDRGEIAADTDVDSATDMLIGPFLYAILIRRTLPDPGQQARIMDTVIRGLGAR